MRLKPRHLEVFNALFEAGSVSRAAERLNLSQPAVSVALGNLETDLGFRLFHRDRGFFAPTSEALMLRDEARQGLAAFARVEQRAAEIRSGSAGAVNIGTNGVLSVNFLPAAIAGFQRDHPGTHFDLRVRSSRQIAAWVDSRQIDIGFIDTPVTVAGLVAEYLRMECVCVMRADDRLAAEATITPAHLAGRSVIGVTGDHGVDRQLDEVMAAADAPLSRVANAYFYAIARNIVAAGDALAVIDPVNGKAALGDGVIWRPFAPKIVTEMAMITNRGHPLGIAAARFRDRARALLAETGPEPDAASAPKAAS